MHMTDDGVSPIAYDRFPRWRYMCCAEIADAANYFRDHLSDYSVVLKQLTRKLMLIPRLFQNKRKSC